MHARLVAQGGEGICVRRLGGDRAGEIRLTRFLRNPAVDVAEMAASAGARTAARCAGRRVLAIQDTTVLRSAGGGGLYLHPVLAVDAADGALLGLVHAALLSRTEGQKASRRQRPVAAKESQRWLDGAEAAARVCAEAAQVTVIADRESDIFAAFARRPAGVALLVRAAHDRALAEGGRLFAALDAQPVAGRTTSDLPARPGQPARTALLALRYREVTLARPRHSLAADALPPGLRLSLVDVREIGPPPGQAPLHWRLLSSEPVADPAAALALVETYRRRWAIEQLFRTLKSEGFAIEALRIAEEAPFGRMAMAALIAAVTIQQLVHARDGTTPEGARAPRALLDAFEPADAALLETYCARLEGKTARQKNPHPKGSLAYAAWVCARLGGWTGYYGKPGPIVMLRGWLRLQAAKHAIGLLTAAADV